MPRAEREAWGFVAQGLEAALAVSDLSPATRGRFVRQLSLARELAGLPVRDLRPAREGPSLGGVA